MSLSKCWTFQTVEKRLHWTRKLSLRLILKTCGLFDTGFTGTKLGVASDIPDPSDVLNWNLDTHVFGDVDSAELIGDVTGMLDGMGDQLVQGPDYLDRFADLSAYLSEDTFSAPPEVSETAVKDTSVACAGQTSSKRKRDTVAVLHTETTTVDHDYVSKKARMTPPTDDAGEASASTSNIDTSSTCGPDEKYRYRRTKNNIASKRSRETRKMKYVEMEGEATRLIKDNESLRERVEILEKLAKEMKAALVEKLTGASQ
ncbi:hypothetical protein ScPMuIL_012571 [Solemya velum]